MSTPGKESSERTPLRPPSQSRSSSININEAPTRTTTTTNTSCSGNGSTTPKRRPSFIIMQAPPTLAPPEETAVKASKAVKLALYVTASTFTAAANAVWFKKMVNAYRPNWDFFAQQFNVFLYVLLAALVVLHKRMRYGAHWWHKQDLPLNVLGCMGFLDAAGSILSTMGGAYTAGAVQTLLNQVIIPMTLALSFFFLGQRFTWAQTMGALIIFVGAAIAVIPSFKPQPGEDGDGDGVSAPATSTMTGVILFFSSIIPGAFSNVYKEWGFAQFHVDLYYLTTCVSFIQVLFGFAFMPILKMPAFGGVPFREIPQQFTMGFQCFLGRNSLPGDDCRDGFSTMIGYVLVNFLFNVFQLLITKHGGATLLVISAALSLPVTNFAFGMPWIMGDETEPFNVYDVVALVVVLGGFILYSAWDDMMDRHDQRKRNLPIQFAAGSVMYLRERSNSDPSTPGYTPLRVEPPKRRGSIDLQLNRKPSGGGGGGGGGEGTRLVTPSKAIPILQQQQRRRQAAGGGSAQGNASYQIDLLEAHDEEAGTVSI